MEPLKKSTNKSARRWLLKQAGPSRTWIVLCVVLGLSGGLLAIFQARFISHIIHGAFIEGHPIGTLKSFFFILAVIIIMRSILCWIREITGFYAGAKVRQETRMALLNHIVTLGPSYTSRKSTGALASTALEHVEGLHDFYAFYLPQLALAGMIPAAILAFVFPYSWAAGGLLLTTAPLIPLFMVLVGMGAENISQRHFQALARMSAHFLDILQGLPTLKVFNRSRNAKKTIAETSNNYRLKTMAVLRLAFLSSAVLEFFSSVSLALVAIFLGMSYLGYFSFGLYGKSLSLETGFFILLLAPDFYLQLRELGTHYHARAEAAGAAEEILKILSVPLVASQTGSATIVSHNEIDIRCRNVCLKYGDDRLPALNSVDFDLWAGQQTALVGASGAGKTTVLNLLLGFLQPESGEIRVNDILLADLNPDRWREHIAWIGQRPVLFHGTIKENILLGRPTATHREIEQAARRAAVLDFSNHLPEGLNSLVGELGYGLSRGQAQRVALARAFVKNAPVLLLDEPTAGLDVENEALVIRALKEFCRNRTVLTLTHRLANIRQADRILVLKDGSIVEQGTYSELMSVKGIFHRLVDHG
ncbi:MAG: cysteine/glutathione ABC transporter permease/ATP-binding protein CydD [Desulfobacterales bacterium]|jgi:ATP-binding cassette subfamily C protein CydD